MQYLYNDGDLYYFMDPRSFEQIPLNHSQVEEAIQFVKENSNANIRFFKGEAFSVEAPGFVDLVISQTEYGFAGNTAIQHLQAGHCGNRV